VIRINLLPRRVTRKKLTVIRHLVLSLLILLLVIIAIGYQWMSYNARITSLRAQVAEAEEEKERLKDVHKEKEMHEKNIQELKSRIDVISQIEKGRLIPIRILDGITQILDDTLPIWLTSLSYNGQQVTMDGYSFTNPDIAKMVKRLEKSPNVAQVELLYTQKSVVKQRELFKFSVVANLEAPAGAEE
jgi:type IV pilus assembly protein PilN